MNKNNRVFSKGRASALSLVLLGMLSGCADSKMSDLRDFVNNAYSDRKPEIEPLPEMKPFQAYEYGAAELDDPFNLGNVINLRGTGAEDTSGLRPDENRPREPLEFFALDELRMKGTMERDGTPWVILQTTQGTAHFLEVGNYMGQNEGRIKEINVAQQTTILMETFLNTNGQWETRDVKLTLED